MVFPLILGVASSFVGGMYAGTVIQNATEAPDVVINTPTANVTEETTGISKNDLLTAGALGVVGYLIYKKWLK